MKTGNSAFRRFLGSSPLIRCRPPSTVYTADMLLYKLHCVMHGYSTMASIHDVCAQLMSFQSSHDRYDTARHRHVFDAHSDQYIVIEEEMVRIYGRTHGSRSDTGGATGYKWR